jgi:hypothetical protein
MKRGLEAGQKYSVKPLKKMVGSIGENLAYQQKQSSAKVVSLEQLLLVALLCVCLGWFAAAQGPVVLREIRTMSDRPMPSVLTWTSRGA